MVGVGRSAAGLGLSRGGTEKATRIAMAQVGENASPASTTSHQARVTPLLPGRAAVLRWPWLRHWELWIALGLAALLRLWRIDLTQFLADQAGLMRLARQAVLLHALPITGIPSSIGTLNPPLSVYLLVPFAVFTPDPMPSVITLALWNVLGVAFCYVFTLRYFDRRAAATAACLFATCSGAVLYSRFLWQQNYLPPVIALWAITLFAGCVRGRAGWLAPNALLLLAAILLHPTAAVFVPITVVAVLLAPHRPRLREYVAIAAGAVVLLAPTVLFESLSGGYDVRQYLVYARGQSHLDLSVLRMFWYMLVNPVPTDNTQPLAWLDPLLPVLAGVTALLIAAGFALLTWRVARPALPRLRALRAQGSARARLSAALVALWTGLRGDAAWRADLLLWLWFALPLLALLRHSSQLYIHYLLVELPVAFVVAGLAADRLLAARESALAPASWRLSHRVEGVLRVARLAVPGVTLVVLFAIVVGQSVRYMQLVGAVASGHFTAYAFDGYPLSELQRADERLRALQRQQAATQVVVEFPGDPRFRDAMDYILSESPDRVGVTDSCLLLPAPPAGPVLVVVTEAASPAVRLLAGLPNAQHVADVPLAGAAPWPVYRVSGTPLLPGDTPAGTLIFPDAAGNGLRLDAASRTAPGVVRLRWTVLQGADSAGPPLWFHVGVSASTAADIPLYGSVDCQSAGWRAGDALFTSVPLTPPAGGTSLATSGPLTVSLAEGALGPVVQSAGPLRVLSARPPGGALTWLRASGPGGAASDGTLVLPPAGASQP